MDKYYAYDVTSSYHKYLDDNFIPLRIKVTDKDGERKSVFVTISADNDFSFGGYTNDERNDANDHLTLNLPMGSNCRISVEGFSKTCLLYTSPSPRDRTRSRMPSSA